MCRFNYRYLTLHSATLNAMAQGKKRARIFSGTLETAVSTGPNNSVIDVDSYIKDNEICQPSSKARKSFAAWYKINERSNKEVLGTFINNQLTAYKVTNRCTCRGTDETMDVRLL